MKLNSPSPFFGCNFLYFQKRILFFYKFFFQFFRIPSLKFFFFMYSNFFFDLFFFKTILTFLLKFRIKFHLFRKSKIFFLLSRKIFLFFHTPKKGIMFKSPKKKQTLKYFFFVRLFLQQNKRKFSRFFFKKNLFKLWILKKRFFSLKIRKNSFLQKRRKGLLKKVRIRHFFFKIFLKTIFSKKKNISLNSILKLQNFFFKFFFFKFDSIFFSFLFSKFLNRFMWHGKRSVAQSLISYILIPLKIYVCIKPNFLFFSMLESTKSILTSIPKNLAGKIHAVPTFLFFDKQFKKSIRSIIKLIDSREDFVKRLENSPKVRKIKLIRTSTLFLRTHKIYYTKRAKFTQRRNKIFDYLNKNYMASIDNRTYTQFRWR